LGSSKIFYHLNHTTAIDIDILVNSISKLLEDDKLRTTIRLQSKRHVERYAWKRIIQRYESVWNYLIKNTEKGLSMFLVPKSSKTPFYRTAYYNIFKDYASNKPKYTDRITLNGNEVLNNFDLRTVIRETTKLSGLEWDRVIKLMENLKEDRNGKRIIDISKDIGKTEIFPIVLFLLKYGLISLIH
jgi:hypothetical protein